MGGWNTLREKFWVKSNCRKRQFASLEKKTMPTGNIEAWQQLFLIHKILGWCPHPKYLKAHEFDSCCCFSVVHPFHDKCAHLGGIRVDAEMLSPCTSSLYKLACPMFDFNLWFLFNFSKQIQQLCKTSLWNDETSTDNFLNCFPPHVIRPVNLLWKVKACLSK